MRCCVGSDFGAGLVVDPGWLVLFSRLRLSLCFHSIIKWLHRFILQPVAFFALYFIEKYVGDF